LDDRTLRGEPAMGFDVTGGTPIGNTYPSGVGHNGAICWTSTPV
jgi:hypothetical protein